MDALHSPGRFLAGLAAVTFLLLLRSPAPAGGQPGGDAKEKQNARELRELKELFGRRDEIVVVTCNVPTANGQLTQETGTIVGFRELLGKRFLILTNQQGSNTMIDCNSIVVIQGEKIR